MRLFPCFLSIVTQGQLISMSGVVRILARVAWVKKWREWCGSIKFWLEWRGCCKSIKFWHGSKKNFRFCSCSLYCKCSVFVFLSFLTFQSLYPLCLFHIQIGVGLKLYTDLNLDNLLLTLRIKLKRAFLINFRTYFQRRI